MPAESSSSQHGAIALDRRLRAGRYRLSTYQRYCDGNCGYLDPPTLRCRHRIRIRSGRVLSLLVEVTFFEGCRIEPNR
jgi:hypothetical protein